MQAKDVAEVLDHHEVMLYRWRREVRRGELVSKKNYVTMEFFRFN